MSKWNLRFREKVNTYVDPQVQEQGSTYTVDHQVYEQGEYLDPLMLEHTVSTLILRFRNKASTWILMIKDKA